MDIDDIDVSSLEPRKAEYKLYERTPEQEEALDELIKEYIPQ